MGWLDAILGVIGFRRVVKIPGKTLFTLSPGDISEMINDHLASGKGLFDKYALYEFVDLESLPPRLEEIRRKLSEIDNCYRVSHEVDGLSSEAGRSALRQLARELQDVRSQGLADDT